MFFRLIIKINTTFAVRRFFLHTNRRAATIRRTAGTMSSAIYARIRCRRRPSRTYSTSRRTRNNKTPGNRRRRKTSGSTRSAASGKPDSVCGCNPPRRPPISPRSDCPRRFVRATTCRETNKICFVLNTFFDLKSPPRRPPRNYFLITRKISPGALSLPFESTART